MTLTENQVARLIQYVQTVDHLSEEGYVIAEEPLCHSGQCRYDAVQAQQMESAARRAIADIVPVMDDER